MLVAATVSVLLSSCAGYSSARHDYTTPPPYPSAPAHPTRAEQSTTLRATEGYRRFLVVRAQRLTQMLWGVANAARAGRRVDAEHDELAAQGDFDAIRADLAPDSAIAVELDGEPWAIGAAPLGGLHAVERDLWALDEPAAAGRAATALVNSSIIAAYELSRAVLSPAEIVAEAQGQLSFVVDVAIPGREEQSSHLDLVDVAAAVRAAKVALDLCAPLGRIVAPATTATATRRLGLLVTAVDALGSPADRADASVPLARWQALAVDADAVNAVLGQLQGEVEGFGTGRLYA